MKFVNWLRRRPVWFWITAWVAWVVIAAIGISICGWDWLNEDESNSATIRNIILAAAALIALPLAIWRGTAAHRQTETAQRQFEIAQRGLLNERYQKGAAMLGSDILSVRLGGIYALSRLSHEHPKEYHTQIMDLLCAFVRFPPTGEEKTDEADCEGQYPRLRQDVQEIMTVIGKRDTEKIEIEKNDGHSLDLFGAHLTGARLVNANLSGVNLSLTNLIGADLSGANLARTHLYCAKMSGAFLSDAFLKNADLSDADLSGAQLSFAHLSHVNLSGTNLNACKGLTQEQLDGAASDECYPANLADTFDAKTGQPLVSPKHPPIDDG